MRCPLLSPEGHGKNYILIFKQSEFQDFIFAVVIVSFPDSRSYPNDSCETEMKNMTKFLEMGVSNTILLLLLLSIDYFFICIYFFYFRELHDNCRTHVSHLFIFLF